MPTRDSKQDERLAVLETLIHERFEVNRVDHLAINSKLDRLSSQVSTLNLWKAKVIGFAVAMATIANALYDLAKGYLLKDF